MDGNRKKGTEVDGLGWKKEGIKEGEDARRDGKGKEERQRVEGE